MAALVFLTACPSPPKTAPRITPLGTTLPPAPAVQPLKLPPPEGSSGTNATRQVALRFSTPTRAGGGFQAASSNALPAVSTPIDVADSKRPEARSLPTTGWVALENWNRLNGLEAPKRFDNGWGATFQCRSTNGVLSLTIGSRVAYWNGLALALGFVPQLSDGLPFLHTLDLRKNFAPLLASSGPRLDGRRIVVLDPGHGGEQTGARSVLKTGFEKDYTLDWALRAKPLLNAKGWRVVLTRTSDVDVPIAERVRIAEQANASLFVSLHFNSVDAQSARPEHHGLETYCLTPTGMPSNLVRQFKDVPAMIFPNNDFDEQNLQLAVRLHHAMVQLVERNDRGIKRARFMTVLREQNRPAVLLEGGYLSDPDEARLIASPAYRQKLAEAVVKALE